jgi:hypothetical protein
MDEQLCLSGDLLNAWGFSYAGQSFMERLQIVVLTLLIGTLEIFP